MRTDPDFTALSTGRLELRRSVPEDAEAISSYRSDPDVHVHQGWEHTDPDRVRADIEEMLSRLPGDPGGWVQFSVRERDGGRLVGDVGLCPAEDEPDVMKVGYTISPAAQGNGFATEAVRALVDYAFSMLEAEIVRAYADEGNTPSRRVMEKVGMVLIERFEGEDESGPWAGVRYERVRHQDPTP
ncbi:MAG: GNAT family N-acetyltransferase [Actinomycetota bacterium]